MGKGGGVQTWEPRADIFPNGLQNLFEKTGWPQQLHNRYWDPNNTYAKRNGGKYNFVCDDEEKSAFSAKPTAVCVPDDQSFWDDLISNHTATGMFMYEQDWSDDEFDWSAAILG